MLDHYKHKDLTMLAQIFSNILGDVAIFCELEYRKVGNLKDKCFMDSWGNCKSRNFTKRYCKKKSQDLTEKLWYGCAVSIYTCKCCKTKSGVFNVVITLPIPSGPTNTTPLILCHHNIQCQLVSNK